MNRISYLYLFTALSLSSCLLPTEKGKVSLDLSSKDQEARNRSKKSQVAVASVSLVNDEIVITGTDLDGVTKVKVTQSGSDSLLSIVSKSATKLILSSSSKVALALNTLMTLTLEDAYGAAVIEVTFDLPDSSVSTSKIGDDQVTTAKIADGAITSVKLSSMGALTGQLLRWNGSSWVAADLDALTYAGTWDASIGGNPNPSAVGGEYYIVSNDGVSDPGDGNSRSWSQGDWIVYNDVTATWDQISNSSDVTSFNGRTGGIIPTTGDYTWAQIDKSTSSIGDISDVDLTTIAPSAGKILKYDGSQWVVGDDLSGGGAGSVSSSEIADGSIVDADVSGSAAISWSKIDKTGATNSDVGLGNVDNIQQMPLSYLDQTVALGTDTNKVPSQNAVKTYVDNATSGMGTVTSITGGAALSDGPYTTTGTIDVQVDDSTIEVATDALQVKALGIQSGHIASGAVTNAKITSVADTKITTACSDGEILSASSGNFVCAQASSVGNWILSGSDLYYSAGNIGIGTSTPSDPLTVSGIARADRMAVGATASVGGNTTFNVDDGRSQFRATTSSPVITGISEVGGNSIHPIFRFYKKRSGATAPQVGFGGSNEYSLEGATDGSNVVAAVQEWGWENSQSNDTTDRDSYFAFYTTQDDVLSEAMRINSQGFVGIGTSNPTSELTINGNQEIRSGNLEIRNGEARIILESTGTNSDAFISFKPDSGPTDQINVGINGVNNSFSIAGSGGIGADDFLSILPNGNIGIGTSTPSSELEVSGTITASGFNGPVTSSSTSVAAGSAANPSYTFSTDTDTGFYSGTADTIEVSVGGTNIFDMTTTEIRSSTVGGGVLRTAASSAATPTFTFNGDEDTGWFSPAADELAATTGASERIRIDSAGNVGIGTDTPNAKLKIIDEVSGQTSQIHTIKDSASSGAWRQDIYRNSSWGPQYVAAHYRGTQAAPLPLLDGDYLSNIIGAGYNGSSTPQGAQIYMSATEDWGVGATGATIRFLTTENGTSGSSERLRIDHNGNVGIGTSSPVTPLEVAGNIKSSGGQIWSANGSTATSRALLLENYDDSANTNGVDFGVKLGGSEFQGLSWAQDTAWTSASGAASKDVSLNFGVLSNDTPLQGMTLSSSGNLGIGTASPTDKLDVNGSLNISNGSWIKFGTNNIIGNSTNTIIRATSGEGIELRVNGSGTEALLIDSSENVGIGTSTPSSKLDVNGVVTATGFSGPVTSSTVSASAGTAAAPSYTFSGDTNTGFYSGAGDTIEVSVGGSNIFDLSIGGMVSATTGGASLGSSNGNAGAPTFSFAGDSDTGWFRPAANTLAASNAGSETMRISSAGNVGIGTSNPTKALAIQRDDGQTSGEHIITTMTRTTPNSLIGGLYFGYRSNGSSDTGGFMRSIGGLPLFLGTLNNQETLLINDSGNVGIGTTSPTEKLEINGGNLLLTGGDSDLNRGYITIDNVGQLNEDTGLLIRMDGDARGSSGYDMPIRVQTDAGGVSADATDKFVVYGDGETFINGWLGVGTPTPDTRIHVEGDSTNDSSITLNNTGTAPNSSELSFETEGFEFASIFALSSDSNSGSLRFRTSDGGILSEQMRITEEGKVGIGESSPLEKFVVGSHGIIMHDGGQKGLGFNTNYDATNGWMAQGAGPYWGVFVFDPANGNLNYANANTDGSTTTHSKFSILSSGNVGIGTTAPQEALDVVGKVISTGSIISGGDTGGVSLTTNDGEGNANLAFNHHGGTPDQDGVAGRVTVNVDETGGTPARMDFELQPGVTNGVSVNLPTIMRIQHDGTSGAIGINKTTGIDDALDVIGDVDATGCFQTDNSGSVGGTCVSDRRLKKDIQPLKGTLDKLLGLRPVEYVWRPEYFDVHKKKGPEIGLIAQEVEEVFPHLVVEKEDGFKRVKYDISLSLYIIQSIKEFFGIYEKDKKVQGRKVASLEIQNEKLKEEVDSIREKNRELERRNQMMEEYLCSKDSSAPFCKR